MNIFSARGYALSQWGRTHIGPARLFIALGHGVLLCSAILLGTLLLPYSGKVQMGSQVLLLLLAGGVALIYPKLKKRGWAVRKRLEGAMLLLGFLGLFLCGPALRENKVSLGFTPALAISPAKTVAPKTQTGVSSFLQKLRKRYLDISLSAKIFFAFVVLVAALSAGVGIAFLVCDLSCSGYEGLATLVLFGGGAIVVGGLIISFTRIFESKARADARKEKQDRRRKQRLSDRQE